MSHSGRVALVTGATGGIGRATVAAFAAAGWMVVGTDRIDDATAEARWFFPADLTSPDEIGRLAAGVGRATDRLDALVNNAAVQIAKPARETDVTDWDITMAINVRAPFLLSVAVYPLLAVSAGAIINVSSVHAIATSTHVAAYAASKGALASLTRALAIEFAPAGVRVNAVLPGAVDTAMLRGHFPGDETQLRDLAARTVMGRIGSPEEVAEAILFLADPSRSSFVTGQILVVDGGATARLSTEAAARGQ